MKAYADAAAAAGTAPWLCTSTGISAHLLPAIVEDPDVALCDCRSTSVA